MNRCATCDERSPEDCRCKYNTTPGRSPTSEAKCDYFRVEVSDHGGQIVAIEPALLSGRDIGDDERQKIEQAIEHLRGFIGTGRLPASEPTCATCKDEGYLFTEECPACAPPSARSDSSVKNVQGGERVPGVRHEENWTLPVEFLEAVEKAMPCDDFAPGLEGIELALLGYEKVIGRMVDTSLRARSSVSAGGEDARAALSHLMSHVDEVRKVIEWCDSAVSEGRAALSRSSGETKTEDGE